MKSEGDRVKELRKAISMKQGDFAERISTTQGHISDIENGRKPLSERTIKLICLEKWNGKIVNENWLRTGDGDMFLSIDRKDQIADLATGLFKGEKDSFKERLILALAGLDESEWELLEKIAENIAKEKD